ncbi:hypothetical protein R1sor_004410 [Riccia sorocarpa]|uniref:Uncharacterized protein n=1 Tax=Riccia sorocarpa TaxID=122646 RepID=A0ABD3HKM4_9MARC
MRDAPCDEEQGPSRRKSSIVEEQHLRRGILLVKIWQEVLKLKLAVEKKDLFSGRLDEFKREMWLLLVAAGSGYLARCWQKTLKPNNDPQLSDRAYHEDPDERPGSPNYSNQLISDTSPNGMRYASRGQHVSPRSATQARSSHSRGLSRKLFADGSNQGQPRSDSGEPDENRMLIGGGGGRASLEGPRTDSKRTPWSTGKTNKKQGNSSVDDEDRESSGGCLRRTGRWVRDRRKSSFSSSSSSSLQRLLLEADETLASAAGSSGRDFESSTQSQKEAIGVDSRPTGLLVVDGNADQNGAQPSQDEPATGAVRDKIFRFEKGKSGTISTFTASSSGTKDESSNSGSKEEKESRSLKAETVNAMLCLRAANLANAQAQEIEREKQNHKVENTASSSQEVGDNVSGGKSKRRSDLGKVSGNQESSEIFPGKRSSDARKSFSRESSEMTSVSFSGKRMKDKEEAGEETDDQAESSLASVFGPIDLSQVFFGFDSLLFGSPKDARSPGRGSRKFKSASRNGNRNLRRMRESPKPLSAIESALRAQESREETPYVSRVLNFGSYEERPSPSSGGSEESPSSSPSSKAQEFAETKVGSSESDKLKGVIGLPALITPRKKGLPPRSKGAKSFKGRLELVIAEANFPRSVISEETERIYPSQSKLNDVVWRRTSLPVFLKKRKVSQAVSPSSIPADASRNAYEFEALVVPPMEGLLYSFGVGIGVMSTMESSEAEIQRLSRLLQESEEKIDHLNELLRESRQMTADFHSPVPAGNISSDAVEVGRSKPQRNVLALVPVMDEPGRERNDVMRKEAPETPQQIEHMAELEAELEAQLGLLTGDLSDYNGTPDFEELDPEGVAGVADHDLVVDGLPAVLDWDDDNDDFVPADGPNYSGGGVSPRELARLLRKVQNSIHERQIHDLEADLTEAEERLQKMEKELQELKARIGSSPVLPPSEGKWIFMPEDTMKMFDLATEVSEFADVTDDGRVLELRPESREDKGPEMEERYIKSSDGAPIRSESGTLETSPILPERSSSRPIISALSIRGSVKSLMLSEETTEAAAQAANDAVCDEFLSSVLSSSLECDKLGGSHGAEEDEEDLGSPDFSVSVIEMPLSPPPTKSNDKSKDPFAYSSNDPRISSVSDPGPFFHDEIPAVTSGEDLDQVVGQLLKRDTSSVKNAIKEFLRWERATDEMVEEEEAAASQMYSRRAAGKNSTPQKSIISSRLEQLARSTFTSGKPRGKSTDVPPQSFSYTKLDDTTTKLSSSRDREASAVIKERPARRETGKTDTSKVNFAPKEGGASSRVASADYSAADTEFQSLLEKRRELRYASTKVGLSLSSAPSAPERDAATYYRQREDPTRAGNNSPIKKLSAKNLFNSSNTKNTLISLETQNNNRLYQNPMSDWLAEVGSPPSEGS